MKTKKENHQRELGKEMLRRSLGSLWIYLPLFLSLMTMKISFILAMFIAGFTGVIVVIRKEVPSGLFTIRGPIAILMGMIAIIIPWGVAAYLFWVEIFVGWWRF